MTCAVCRPWAATTEEQLARRIRNLQIGRIGRAIGTREAAMVFACEMCGGTDWATTRECIKAPQPEPSRLRKFLQGFGLVLALTLVLPQVCKPTVPGWPFFGTNIPCDPQDRPGE